MRKGLWAVLVAPVALTAFVLVTALVGAPDLPRARDQGEASPGRRDVTRAAHLAGRPRPPRPAVEPGRSRVAPSPTPPPAPSPSAVRPVTRPGEDSRAVASLPIVERGRTQADRDALRRHVELFVPHAVRAGPEDGPGVDGLTLATAGRVRLLAAGRPGWKDLTLLARGDPAAVEKRRLEQLDRLASRGATDLLDPIHASLLWLALHQGDDGRWSDTAARARCLALGHTDAESRRGGCLARAGGPGDRSALATTSLVLLAFLDFRDQDARGLFEPNLASGLAWLRGTLASPSRAAVTMREHYDTAMALMALGEATASTGDERTRAELERGLADLYACRGREGGYRYEPRASGDLSVSGWVAQALETARWAGAEIPDKMADDLGSFLDRTWIQGPYFSYQADTRGPRETLFPVGMLMAGILWGTRPPTYDDLASWRAWLEAPNRPVRAPPLYTLYYGLRVSLELEGKLADPWASWTRELADRQVREGDATGLFRAQRAPWLRSGGTVLVTAVATLTMEHALYAR